MGDEVVIASSSIDAGIGCWDLHSGADLLRYKSCASPSHALISVGNRFLASSQLRDAQASSGSILYWSWSKPQVEVKSFPEEPIKPLAANTEGAYIVGGGLSGHIYFWEVASGRLLKKWRAHYRTVTCLVFSEDDSLLVSASEDGSVKVWPLLMIFDDHQTQPVSHLFLHSFSGHTLRVTDVVIGYGGDNAIVVSASEDRTCKVWSLSTGILLRTVAFPSIIDAVSLDPGEHVFYAGCRDGNIYLAALNADGSSSKSQWLHMVGSLSTQSVAITCLVYSTTKSYLLAGSEDGMIRAWDLRTRTIVRTFKHAKGPVNNIQIARRPLHLNPRGTSNAQTSSRRNGSLLPPPLDKYMNSTDQNAGTVAIVCLSTNDSLELKSYLSSEVIVNQIKELKQQGSAAAAEMEVERLKHENREQLQMLKILRKINDNIHELWVNGILDGDV